MENLLPLLQLLARTSFRAEIYAEIEKTPVVQIPQNQLIFALNDIFVQIEDKIPKFDTDAIAPYFDDVPKSQNLISLYLTLLTKLGNKPKFNIFNIKSQKDIPDYASYDSEYNFLKKKYLTEISNYSIIAVITGNDDYMNLLFKEGEKYVSDEFGEVEKGDIDGIIYVIYEKKPTALPPRANSLSNQDQIPYCQRNASSPARYNSSQIAGAKGKLYYYSFSYGIPQNELSPNESISFNCADELKTIVDKYRIKGQKRVFYFGKKLHGSLLNYINEEEVYMYDLDTLYHDQLSKMIKESGPKLKTQKPVASSSNSKSQSSPKVLQRQLPRNPNPHIGKKIYYYIYNNGKLEPFYTIDGFDKFYQLDKISELVNKIKEGRRAVFYYKKSFKDDLYDYDFKEDLYMYECNEKDYEELKHAIGDWGLKFEKKPKNTAVKPHPVNKGQSGSIPSAIKEEQPQTIYFLSADLKFRKKENSKSVPFSSTRDLIDYARREFNITNADVMFVSPTGTITSGVITKDKKIIVVQGHIDGSGVFDCVVVHGAKPFKLNGFCFKYKGSGSKLAESLKKAIFGTRTRVEIYQFNNGRDEYIGSLASNKYTIHVQVPESWELTESK